MRTGSWPRVLLGLAVLVGLAAPAFGAGAAPVVVAPASSTPQYLGFHGPFTVDFNGAPSGAYEYSVKNGSAEVVDGPHDLSWSGSGSSEQQLSTGVLPPGDYTFVVHQVAFEVPDAILDFTVRDYAQPTCSVSLPRAVRVNSGEEVVTGVLGANCTAASVTYASWEVDHLTRGFRNLMTFDHKSRDTFSIFGPDPLGSYLITPTQSINAAADDIRQNTPRMEVRLDSRLGLRSHRTGSRVTLTATFTKYLRSANRFGAWTRRPVTFSSRTCRTCAWHRLAVRRTDGHGHAVLRVRAAKVRGYRVFAGGAALVWAPYPKYTRR